MQEGTIVARKSYNHDIYFRIDSIVNDKAILKGTSYRLVADSYLDDLKIISLSEYKEYESAINNQFNSFIQNFLFNMNKINNLLRNNLVSEKKTGKILHIDGDNYYLNNCLEKYRRLGIEAIGIYLDEIHQAENITKLLNEHNPNILIITGHDNLRKGDNSWSNINNYRNSSYFIEAINNARKYNCNYDQLVILAGGCQSYYEELIYAGANFASSPNRILIHHLDHAIAACKIAYASVKDYVDSQYITTDTFGGIGGIGGIETRGQCREIVPPFKLKKLY